MPPVTGRCFEITDADIARGADLLARWVGPDRYSSDLIRREFVAELVASVCRPLETTALRSFLRHDRSFYQAPEL